MTRRRKNIANERLAPVDRMAVLRAVIRLTDDPTPLSRYGVSSNLAAREAGVEGARRHGRGAVKGSWSGRMSAALRVAPTLRSLARAGLLTDHYDIERHRWYYVPTEAGRKAATQDPPNGG